MTILRYDHVQLAIPEGGEPAARHFYAELLGIPEVRKPVSLVARGGAWFERGELKLHIGVDPDFRPARKAHPALLVSDLSALVERLRRAGVEIVDGDPLPGHARVFVTDPFGNRIELVEQGREPDR